MVSTTFLKNQEELICLIYLCIGGYGIPRDAHRILERMFDHYYAEMGAERRAEYTRSIGIFFGIYNNSIQAIGAGPPPENIGDEADVLMYINHGYFLVRLYQIIEFFFTYDSCYSICRMCYRRVEHSNRVSIPYTPAYVRFHEHTRNQRCILINSSSRVRIFDAANYLRPVDASILLAEYELNCPYYSGLVYNLPLSHHEREVRERRFNSHQLPCRP